MPRPLSRFRAAGLAALPFALLWVACGRDNLPTAPSAVGPPKPSPAAPALVSGTTQVLIGAGDIASLSNLRDDSTALLLDSLVTANPDAVVFTAGDNANPDGSATDYANAYDPTWGRQKSRTRPAPGDRDYITAGAAGYFGYFGAAAGDPSQGYYSYDLGGWHVVVLNSQVSTAAGSAQESWLKADLAASPAQCTAAIWHVPLFSSTTGAASANVKPLWDALYAAGADVVLNANSKNYERFAPQSPAGAADATYGIREFIVGTGGTTSGTFGTTAANSQVRGAGAPGVLKLTLTDNGYSWNFLAIKGRTFTDSGSGTCHGAPPSPTAPPVANPGGPYTSSDGSGAVTFDGSQSSDPQGDLPLTYAWDFGDNATGTGSAPSHTYAANGTFNVSLIVTDSKGNKSASATTTATVTNISAPPPSGSPVFVGAGDIAGCTYSRDEATAKLLDGVVSGNPDAVVWTAGDNAYDHGTAAEYANCYTPTWGRHKARTYAAIGNHEYEVDPTPTFDYFGDRVGPRGKGFYSFDLGSSWHVIVLNDNINFAAGSEQDQWLQADLAANTKLCTIAIWHGPYAGSTYNSAGAAPKVDNTRKIIWDRLFAAGVEIVLNGHRHFYERLAQQTPALVADKDKGIREFIVGTGGASSSYPNVAGPNTLTRASTYGVLQLTLNSTNYSWKFIPIAGQTYTDSGTDVCF